MKVLLIYPPVTLHRLDVSGAQWCAPMGLAYVGTAIQQAGHEVDVVNCLTPDAPGNLKPTPHRIDADFTRHGFTDDQIADAVRSGAPDLVGVACMYTPYSWDAHNVARIVKKVDPKIPVVFGGAHTSTFSDIVMRDENVDVAVVGEGEATICDVLDRYGHGRSLDGCEGIIHRTGGLVKREPPRPFIDDLDDITFPNWDLMPREVEHAKRCHMSDRFLMRPPIGRLLTSRGCPKDCYFCSVKLMWTKRWRARSAKNVVDEIESLADKYGYREFHFVDDNSSVSKKRMHEICGEILSRKLDVRLATPTGIAIATLDREVLVKMKRAGFYRFCFGIETGDQAAQQTIGKRIDLDKAREVIAIANSLGYWTSATFILGFPHEARADVQKTIDFAKMSNLDFAVFYLLTPQPGTEVYGILKQQGLIDLDPYLDPHSEHWYRVGLTYINGFRNANLTNSELQELLSSAYKQFLLHKVFSLRTYFNAVRKIRSVEDFKYLLHLLHPAFNMLRQIVLGLRLSSGSIRRKQGELEHTEL